MHILRFMGSKFCVKFQRCPLKFHTKFWTHTPQNMHFTRCEKFDDICYFKNYDLLSLSDTGPWGLGNIRYPSKTHLKLKPREISFIHDTRFSCLIVLTFCTEHGTDIALLCANFTRARLGRVTPLGRPKQVYKSNVECRFLGFWVETAKLPWRSSSMTPSLNTSWENPKMHI